MIAFLSMLTVPPPPPPERTTPLPSYLAQCKLVGRDSRDHGLSLSVSGMGETRRAVFRKGSGSLKRLVANDEKTTVTSFGNGLVLWDTTDFIKARLTGRPVTVWLQVNPNPSEGAAIRIMPSGGQFSLPLFAGMCRTKPVEASTSS